MIPLPTVEGGFGCALLDPPWAFRTYDKKKSVASRTETDPYPTMKLDDIKALPFPDILAKDAAVFMWIVGAHLEEALELGKSWNLRYVTDAFVWDKGKMGMGYWTRKESETCLLFTRGKPKRLSKSVRQVIRAPRREHSRKPDQTYERIEALVAGPYVEIFSRTSRPGWASWGNDQGRFNDR